MAPERQEGRRKPLVPPSGDGGLANILSKPRKLLTYKGKIIAYNKIGQYLDDDTADRVVAEDVTWKTIVDDFLSAPVELSKLRNDDGTEINSETQCVSVNDVPADTTFLFVLEPAFYEV